MQQDVLQLARDLISIHSVSRYSNAQISDFLEQLFKRTGFDVERLSHIDANGEEKVSLVARRGEGSGGLGFFSHSDTVPGGEGWDPLDPVIENDHLIGRGSCDMKGPLAATIVAAAEADTTKLNKPLYVVVTADEEVGYAGAVQVIEESQMLGENWPQFSVVAEPTQLIPVYAHKGGTRVTVTAHGRAAHTSTDQGVSANFLIAPFFAEMAELAKVFKQDERFMNREFNPPTNGFNMVIDDGGTKSNVTAAKTTCTLSLRSMTNDHHEEAVKMIVEKAKQYNLDVEYGGRDPFYITPNADIIDSALAATGESKAETVPFGTEASVYHPYTEAVILGPGNIKQAHTLGEWIDIGQLRNAVDVYTKMIDRHCV